MQIRGEGRVRTIPLLPRHLPCLLRNKVRSSNITPTSLSPLPPPRSPPPAPNANTIIIMNAPISHGVQYVATIRRTLRPGGVWINCGPLHWHNRSALALSLDEMLALVAGSGFRLKAVERLPPCAYRVQDGGESLRVDEFKPVFWVATLD